MTIPVPADLQSAGIELGDLQSPILTLALMAFSCFGGKDNGFHTIKQAFFSRITNADIQGWRITNPPEQRHVFFHS